MELIAQRNAQIFGCLSPSERKEFGRMLDGLIAHAKEQGAAGANTGWLDTGQTAQSGGL